MTLYDQRVTRLAEAIKSVMPKAQVTLDARKREAKELNEHSDFVWHLLLSSASTLGRADGWDGLIGDEQNYVTVSYSALQQLTPVGRKERLRKALRKAKIRYPEKKAEQLAWNFELIEAIGGVDEAKRQLDVREPSEWKLHFLEQFKGVGPKYSRNMMMDIYHPDFRNSIAVDSRLQDVLEELGFQEGDMPSYEQKENFFLWKNEKEVA